MIIRRPARAAHRGQPRPRARVLSVLLAAAVLVGGVNLVAYAANGKPLLLGRFNAEGRTAVVKNNGRGPAMDLRSRPGAPSLKVSSTKKVPKLNADKVDGRNAAALQTQGYEFVLQPRPATKTFRAKLDVPAGRYLASYTLYMVGEPTCWFQLGLDRAAYGNPLRKVDFSSLTGTAIIDTRSLDKPPQLLCSHHLNNSRLHDTIESTVSLVKLDRVRSRNVQTEE